MNGNCSNIAIDMCMGMKITQTPRDTIFSPIRFYYSARAILRRFTTSLQALAGQGEANHVISGKHQLAGVTCVALTKPFVFSTLLLGWDCWPPGEMRLSVQ